MKTFSFNGLWIFGAAVLFLNLTGCLNEPSPDVSDEFVQPTPANDSPSPITQSSEDESTFDPVRSFEADEPAVTSLPAAAETPSMRLAASSRNESTGASRESSQTSDRSTIHESSSKTGDTVYALVVLKVYTPDSSSETGVASNTMVAGVARKASDQFDDAFDIRAFLSDSFQAYFDHVGEPGYDDDSGQLWQDYQSSRSIRRDWPIAVSADSGRTVTLEWALPVEGLTCDNKRFVLVDSGVSIDLCAQSQYSYVQSGNGIRKLTLRVF